MASDLKQIKISSVEKRSIDPRSALRSTLRSWLVYRDRAVWCLVSGADADTGDPILDRMDLTPALPVIERMNLLREVAYDLAAQIDDKRAETVLRGELEALLEEESPRFLLRVEGIPDSF